MPTTPCCWCPTMKATTCGHCSIIRCFAAANRLYQRHPTPRRVRLKGRVNTFLCLQTVIQIGRLLFILKNRVNKKAVPDGLFRKQVEDLGKEWLRAIHLAPVMVWNGHGGESGFLCPLTAN